MIDYLPTKMSLPIDLCRRFALSSKTPKGCLLLPGWEVHCPAWIFHAILGLVLLARIDVLLHCLLFGQALDAVPCIPLCSSLKLNGPRLTTLHVARRGLFEILVSIQLFLGWNFTLGNPNLNPHPRFFELCCKIGHLKSPC